MISVEDAVLAKLVSHGEHFEILVDPEKARTSTDISEILAVQAIFKDAKKGDHASEEHMKKIFGTSDVLEVAKIILKKGDVQLTTQQRKEMAEERRKQVIDLITRQAINPQAKTPYTPARIEIAMEEAKVRINPFKKAEEQVEEVMKALRPLIPIRFEVVEVATKIPPQYTGAALTAIHKYKLKRESWQNDGSYICVVEIPAGLQDEFYSDINKATKGNSETRILESNKESNKNVKS